MKKKTKNLIRRICRSCLRPPPKLKVSQWAERDRVMDGSSAFPGRWSNAVTPYLVDIMDEYNNPYTREIVFCKPTQVGGTEVLLNILGYIATEEPAPTMAVLPSDALSESFSDSRVQPMIDASAAIKDAYLERRSKKLEKRFTGMTLYLASSGSPAKLASKAVKNLFLDETDKWKGASKTEASPYKLARERTKTYPLNKKIYDNCTPTIESGHIWQQKETSDVERHYFVPCPHCNQEIELKFEQIKWPHEDAMTNAEKAEQAVYVCQACGAVIEDVSKPWMLRRGCWKEVVRRIGKKQIPKKVAFWLNTLYSPFVTWGDIALEFLNCRDDPEELQNFVNSWLAKPWKDARSTTDEAMVMRRQTEVEAFTVPDWAQLLVAGVDVQRDSMYWVIRAWGANMTSQNIAHGQALSFDDIERYMNLEYLREDGAPMIVSLCAIDSGDGETMDAVYEFCATNSEWAVPIKGQAMMYTYFRITTINRVESRANGTRLVLVDGGRYKDIIASRLQRENGQGSFMVHKDCDEEYARQLTAEHKVTERHGTKMVQIWKPKVSHGDNHYLDAEVYALVAADLQHVRNLHMETHQAAAPPKAEKPKSDGQWVQQYKDWV